MCGIVGAVTIDHREAASLARALNSWQVHRGPDHQAEELVAPGIAFGYSRLAIVGVGESGNQPIHTRSGHVSAVFNGEIYNSRELAARFNLPPCPSDGYVAIELWERMGSAALDLLRGMFGFAIYDHRSGAVTLTRDRFGMKPLYYRLDKHGVSFASELRSLVHATTDRLPELARAQIAHFLSFGSLPTDCSPFVGFESLRPGTFATIEWVAGTPALTRVQPFTGPEEALDRPVLASFRDVIVDSVSKHLEADIDVSLLLSAGIDSTLLAMGARDLGRRLMCLTVEGLLDGDETPLARATAKAYGHDFQPVPVSLSETGMASFFRHMQRPTIDGLNTFLVCQAVADAGFRVALSGLGGDEAMGGYSHAKLLPLVRARARLGAVGNGAARLAKPAVNRAFGGRTKLQQVLGPSGPKTALELCLLQRELFGPSTVAALSGSAAVAGSPEAAFHLSDSDGSLKAWAAAERAIYMESTLIPDADAFSMAHSVELRVPFVDHVLRSFTLGVPERVGRARGKARFVNTIADETLHAVAQRPKTGFTVPMPRLMQSDPLRAYVAAAHEANAPIWDVLDRATGAPILSNSTTSRWSEAWALVALNSWLGSFQHSEVPA